MAKKLPIEELEKRAPKEQLVEYYNNNTLVETMKHFGLSVPQCDRLFEHYGIEKRSRAEALAMSRDEQSEHAEEEVQEVEEVVDTITIDSSDMDDSFEEPVLDKSQPILEETVCGRVILKEFVSSYLKSRNIKFFEDYRPSKDKETRFDFAIFKSGKLDLLIDCDCIDEEFDELRQLDVPQGVKFYAIGDASGAEYIDRLLKLDFNQYVQETFTEYKKSQFPSVDKVLSQDKIESWYEGFVRGACNTQSSKNILQYYHPSVLECNKRGRVRPLDVWQFDKLLVSCIIRGYLYPCTKNISYRAATGITMTEVAPAATIVDPIKLKYLIDKYLLEYDEVFSPTVRFSETMLATCASNKKFVGEDTHKKVLAECAKLIEDLKLDATVSEAEPYRLKRYHKCLLAIVPFSDEVILSTANTMSSDDYIDQWVSAFKCNKYIFVVDSTLKYKKNISETIVDGDRKLNVVVISK